MASTGFKIDLVLTQWFAGSFEGLGFEIFCFGMILFGLAMLLAVWMER